MGTYLTDEQIAKAREELFIIYAIPYRSMVVGPAWEHILADIKGGRQSGGAEAALERWRRDNRAIPDIVVPSGDHDVNYSVKTEGLKATKSNKRARAADFLGHHEDIIGARPKVDDLLEGRSLAALTADEFGGLVLRYYHEQIVVRYRWDVISFLLQLDVRPPYEFIYWEERPPVRYSPEDYWWRDSTKATRGNRNIAGYPRTVSPDSIKLPPAKFKFTSGGKQFYVDYNIPHNADVWSVEKATLSIEEVRQALQDLLRRQQQTSGHESAT